MKSLLPLTTLVGLVSTQAEAGFWKQWRKSMQPRYVVSAPVVYQPITHCYSCCTPVYQPVYQPVVYRPIVKKPHVSFSFGTHGAGFSFWS